MWLLFLRQETFMNKKLKNDSNGQSLVEVIASLGVVILVVAALVNLVTASLRSSNYAKTAAQANKYAQDGIEWMRSLRDAEDWDIFKDRTGSWCLRSFSEGLTTGVCTVTGTIFKREVEISEDTPSRVKVKVTVKWNDQAGEHKSQVETIFTDTSTWH